MNIKISIILIIVLLPFKIFSQVNKTPNDNEVLKLYNDFETYYSIDDEIVNGCPYTYSSKKIIGTPFLYNEKWNDATIYINKKSYTNYKLKYDLVKKLIIIKIKYEGDNEQIISLNKYNVDSFAINSTIFINSIYLSSKKTDCIFYEEIFKDNISMYRLYNKRFINLYDEMTPYGKFSQLKSNLYLLKNKSFYKINSSRAFIKYFDKVYRKEIKLYLNKNNLNIKTASPDKLRELMIYCNTLTTKKI